MSGMIEAVDKPCDLPARSRPVMKLLGPCNCCKRCQSSRSSGVKGCVTQLLPAEQATEEVSLQVLADMMISNESRIIKSRMISQYDEPRQYITNLQLRLQVCPAGPLPVPLPKLYTEFPSPFPITLNPKT